jgi:hypothetical protein
LRKEGEKISLATGYRSFIKYELFKQRAYVQAEDWIDPARANPEKSVGTRHSILIGAGYILPIGKKLGINGALLYRINNNDYNEGASSPWVIRIGISSIGSAKHK